MLRKRRDNELDRLLSKSGLSEHRSKLLHSGDSFEAIAASTPALLWVQQRRAAN
jgi:hypothetical protein